MLQKKSRKTYKNDHQKVVKKSDFRTYTRKSNRASNKLSEHLTEWIKVGIVEEKILKVREKNNSIQVGRTQEKMLNVRKKTKRKL